MRILPLNPKKKRKGKEKKKRKEKRRGKRRRKEKKKKEILIMHQRKIPFPNFTLSGSPKLSYTLGVWKRTIYI
jgi:hypothetical protein